MLVVALIVAAGVGYSLFGERIFPADQALVRSHAASIEVLRPEVAGRPDGPRG